MKLGIEFDDAVGEKDSTSEAEEGAVTTDAEPQPPAAPGALGTTV